ncbi:MAG: hypothetical protein M3Q99_09290 [Acidobacteriota bacterium]|nr:hypothetical protein [Acidobacteriota bacterium]
MLTGIRKKTIVKEGGKVEIFLSDLSVGTEVEVIVLVEQDTTEYLLSTEANRRHLKESRQDAGNFEKLIYVDVENLLGKLLLFRKHLRTLSNGPTRTRKITQKSLNS